MNYHLCGGVFLSLLIHAKKQGSQVRKRYDTKSNTPKESDILKGLIKLFYSNFETKDNRTFTSDTSKYKTCKKSSSKWLPFDEKIVIGKYDEKVRKHYSSAYEEMKFFIINNLNIEDKKEWLARSILLIIEKDMSVNHDFLTLDGQISKSKLLTKGKYDLVELLLATWHYILLYKNDNLLCDNTYTTILNNCFHLGKAYEKITIKELAINTSQRINDDDTGYCLPEYLITSLQSYCQKAYIKYSTIKTLLSYDAPQNFKDIYICNNLYRRLKRGIRKIEDIINDSGYKDITYENCTIKTIKEEIGERVIITGSGGLGKSMMMRHLLIDSLENIDIRKNNTKIPILVLLKDFDSSYESLGLFIWEKFNLLAHDIPEDVFYNLLEKNHITLLLDAIDEINDDLKQRFSVLLQNFTDYYPDIPIIMTSRVFDNFVTYTHFTTVKIQPLSNSQALELIDKIKFRPDAPEIKEKFKSLLINKLFKTHADFAENPLLLNIMLLTFEQYADIPAKMHIFYYEAFMTLAKRHDASKGAFKRKFKTNLSAEEFHFFLEKIMTKLYIKGIFAIKELEFKEIFDQLFSNEKDIDANDFLYDISVNLSIMYFEDGAYHFTHRSFQEYFCASFFSHVSDDRLKKLIPFFENYHKGYTIDNVFNMLFDMITDRVEKNIIIPFISDLINKYRSEYGYWSFLYDMYTTIEVNEGDVLYIGDNNPTSFIYRNILTKYDILTKHNFDSYFYSVETEFHKNDYVEYHSKWNEPIFQRAVSLGIVDEDEDLDLIELNELETDVDYIRKYGTPDIIGSVFEIDIYRLIEDMECYHPDGTTTISPQNYIKDHYNSMFWNTVKTLNAETFPLHIEYRNLIKLLEKLQKQHSKKDIEFDDLFK